MLNSNFEALLRQAANDQLKRDEETQKLKDKKKRQDVVKQQNLFAQFKRVKPSVSSRLLPAEVAIKPNSMSSDGTSGTKTKALSFAEMMRAAEDNVKNGISLLDAKKMPTSTSCKSLKRRITETEIKAKPIARKSSNALSLLKPTSSNIRKSRPENIRPPVSKKPRRYSDEEDNGSDLDDFIDDDDENTDVNRELQSVVKSLCRSDKETWKQRERTINLRNMDNSYRGVEMEEKRSAMLARQEDRQEEARGAKRI